MSGSDCLATAIVTAREYARHQTGTHGRADLDRYRWRGRIPPRGGEHRAARCGDQPFGGVLR